MDIENAVALANTFADREHETHCAVLFEPDEVLAEKQKALDELFTFPGVSNTIHRPTGAALPPREEAEQRLQTQAAKRLLLKVEVYPHPSLGTLCVAYLSSTFALGGAVAARPDVRLFMASRSEGDKIIAEEGACYLCRGTGQVKGNLCSRCGGKIWESLGGESIALGDQPAESRNFNEA